MDGRCATCKWWERSDYYEDGVGYCDLAGSESGTPDHPESLAWASDAESYAASLKTRAEFGCVQWEAME